MMMVFGTQHYQLVAGQNPGVAIGFNTGGGANTYGSITPTTFRGLTISSIRDHVVASVHEVDVTAGSDPHPLLHRVRANGVIGGPYIEGYFGGVLSAQGAPIFGLVNGNTYIVEIA